MIIGIGIDLLEIKRIGKIYNKFNNRFVNKIFTPIEQQLCENISCFDKKMSKYAGRFAAKEAFVKALGTGFSNNIKFCDMEIVNNALGKPCISIKNQAKKLTEQLCTNYTIHLAITHTDDLIQALVIIEDRL